jgi:hypothetical protein
VTLTVALTLTSPLTTLPDVGSVKHKVTVYAPDEGVLDAQVLVEIGVAVAVADGVGVGVRVGLGVLVGLGAGLPCE